MRMNRDLDSIDTAVAYDSTSWPILRMTNDGLVAFNQASGLAGTQLVPDLAVSLPTPTDGGRTYTFQLRPNIRYSNGRPVKASDFRCTFERDFEIGKLPVQYYYDGIVGATRCEKHPKRCDLSHGIVADDAAKTVTFHLVAPDPEFLVQARARLRIRRARGDAADASSRTHPLPATGPYMIASYRPNHLLRLVRNPYFHEWSKAAQPDGYPDEIVVRDRRHAGRGGQRRDPRQGGRLQHLAVARRLRPQGQLAAIKTQHASQVHTNPQPATIALFLNTRVAPFDRLDVRRALNYAADRAAAVQATGGPDVAQATCQILPPHFPGYRPYCPYTAEANAGTGRRRISRRRVRSSPRSGTRGMKVTVWSWADLRRPRPVRGEAASVAGLPRLDEGPLARLTGYFAGRRRLAHEGADRDDAMDLRLSRGFRLLQRHPHLRLVPARQPGQLERLRVLRPADRPADQASPGEQATNPDAARGLWERVDQADRRPGAVGAARQPEGRRRALEARRQLPVQPRRLGMLIDQLWVR